MVFITRWTLYLTQTKDGKVTTVSPQSYVTLQPQSLPLTASFDWRPEYEEIISVDGDNIKVDTRQPWYSSMGIFHHYQTIISAKNTTVQFIPTFLFGVPSVLKTKLYQDTQWNALISGMFTDSVTNDRIIIQTFMALVALTVVLLLKMKY